MDYKAVVSFPDFFKTSNTSCFDKVLDFTVTNCFSKEISTEVIPCAYYINSLFSLFIQKNK